jgi:hypothetical protein
MERISRVATSAATIPTADPATTGAKESRSTILTTRRRAAPNAIRTPIYRVRRATEYASTP